MDIGNLLRIWHEIRSETLRNDVFRAFLFSNAKKNVFVGLYELTQLPIRKIINIAQKLKTIDSEIPFKGCRNFSDKPLLKLPEISCFSYISSVF